MPPYKFTPKVNVNQAYDVSAECMVRAMPTFHPAYLLRSPGMKPKCWEDIQLAMKLLGLEPPKRGA